MVVQMDYCDYNKGMNMQAIGAFFRGARLARGWKPEEVALKMAAVLNEPVSPATIYKIEGARMNPGLDKVLALLRVLGIDPRTLLMVARDEGMSKVRGEELGRSSVGDDLAWLEELSEEERAKARDYFENN